MQQLHFKALKYKNRVFKLKSLKNPTRNALVTYCMLIGYVYLSSPLVLRFFSPFFSERTYLCIDCT